jgi:hypothetical protein
VAESLRIGATADAAINGTCRERLSEHLDAEWRVKLRRALQASRRGGASCGAFCWSLRAEDRVWPAALETRLEVTDREAGVRGHRR